jgi:hypothetical protein
MPNLPPVTFKTLCDAAVTMGEMSEGTAEYFHSLYLNSAECRELTALRVALDKSEAYCRKMDGILEEVGGVTVSCINPYEDLKRAMLALKATRDGKRYANRQY